MNRYMSCPHCGSQNRESDANCYQCNGLLKGAGPSAAAPASSAPPAPMAPLPGTAVPGYRKTIEKVDRDSTIVHGLRSGALAGVATGLICGLTCSLFGSVFFGALMDSLPGTAMAGALIFILVFFSNIIYGTIFGAILGGMNVLCYQADCLKFGSIAGGIIGLAFWAIGGFHGLPTGILAEAGHGAMLGYLASYMERRVFRKQYAEL
jgi:hypothetical protein